jgi:hypothetical protein
MIYLLWLMLLLLSASGNVQHDGIMFGEFRTRKYLAATARELMVLLLPYLSRESTKGHITLVRVGNVPPSYKNATPPRY